MGGRLGGVFMLSPPVRRFVGSMGVFGAVVDVLLSGLWAVYVSQANEEPGAPGVWFYGFVLAILFGLIAWQSWEARTGPMLRSFRVLFGLLTPFALAVFLFFARATGGSPFVTLMFVAQASLAVALPVLALARSPLSEATSEDLPAAPPLLDR